MRWLSLIAMSIVVVACADTKPSPSSVPVAAPVPGATPGRTTVVGQAPPGTVVTLESSIPREEALPAGPAILDQYARNFVPDLLVVRVGQRVEFRNSEDVDHNVTVVRSPTGSTVFDTSTAPYQKYEHTFDRAGRYEVSCDIHPGMRATIVATTTPHAVLIDQSRRFTFADLEPAAYKLTVSGGARTLERTIEVSGPQLDLGNLVP